MGSAADQEARGPAATGGRGVYRRRIRLVSRPRAVRAGLEDDAHRFALVLRHDGRRVVDLEARAERYPWSTCPAAGEALRALRGLPLRACAEPAREVDPASQCTHLLDLAGLAAAHAAAGRRRRQYDCAVPEPEEGGTAPVLHRDGRPLLAWRIEGARVISPDPFAGVRLGRGFEAWATRALDPETAEAARVLRRACFIARVRGFDSDAHPRATGLPARRHSCFSFSEPQLSVAARVPGMRRDFTDAPQRLLEPADPAPESGA